MHIVQSETIPNLCNIVQSNIFMEAFDTDLETAVENLKFVYDDFDKE